MGLLDKVKAGAGQVAAKASQGTAKVQAKIETEKEKRAADALLRDLGAAYYAEARQGGSHDAVEQALSALDTHVSQTGVPIGAASATGAPGDLEEDGPDQEWEPEPVGAQPSMPGGTPGGGSGGAVPGDFNLDDV